MAMGMRSDIKEEVDNVAILHHIFLAFAADFAEGLCISHGAAFLHIIEGNNLCTNKAALKVRMDFTCRLGCFCARCNRPSSNLRLTCCQVLNKT